jgi:hypothetical protein
MSLSGNCWLAVSEFVRERGGGDSGGGDSPEGVPRPIEAFRAGMGGVPLVGLVGEEDLSLDIWRSGDFGGAVGKGSKGDSGGSRVSPSGLLMKLRGRELRFAL